MEGSAPPSIDNPLHELHPPPLLPPPPPPNFYKKILNPPTIIFSKIPTPYR